MRNFSVTFERYLPHDPEDDICDADERGFILDNASLRDAIAEAGGLYASYQADEWPIRAPRSFTNATYNEGTDEYFREGISESRSLHVPDQITASSRRRIARILRCLR